MEVIVGVMVVFLIGYAVGRKRSAKRRTATQLHRTRTHLPDTRPVRREYTRDREYGGFGALGATHESSDFGDGGS